MRHAYYIVFFIRKYFLSLSRACKVVFFKRAKHGIRPYGLVLYYKLVYRISNGNASE